MNQKISGLYEGRFSDSAKRKTKKTELELRVDVDGFRPLNIISGDFFSSRKRNYLSSFIFQDIKKREVSNDDVQLIGEKGKFSSNSERVTDFQVDILAGSNPMKAIVKWTNKSGTEVTCMCKRVSEYFRSVYIEHDYEEGVMPLEPYETAELPSPAPIRSNPISIIDAFAEAGIKIIVLREERDSVASPKDNSEYEAVWTNSKLHKAMLEHFTSFSGNPQWKLWLLSAKQYVMSNIYGIMIDPREKKRTGCAVFQEPIGWQLPEEKRFRLFIYIHELGHCFNLHHPWDEPQDDPSERLNQYAILSWMNLPKRYYSSEASYGEEAFWEAFDFKFSHSELMHLRHGFRNDVIFGGNTYSTKSFFKGTT